MAIDNTHVKYLKGNDKKAWNNFKEAYEAQNKLENFMNSLGVPNGLKEGEVYDIPLRKKEEKDKS